MKSRRTMAPPACSPAESTAISSFSQTEPFGTPATSFADDEAEDVDKYNLQRYVDAQDKQDIYNRVVASFRAGCRKPQPATWLWCVFPQMNGCQTALVYTRRRGLIRDSWPQGKAMADGLDEARAILQHPILGPRVRAAARALVDSPAPDVFTAMDNMFYDVARLHSSITIFRQAARYPVCIHQRESALRQNMVFREVLNKYFVKDPDSEDDDYNPKLEDEDEVEDEGMGPPKAPKARKGGSRHSPTLERLDRLELEAAEERLAAHKPCVCGLDMEALANKDIGSKVKITDRQRKRLTDR